MPWFQNCLGLCVLLAWWGRLCWFIQTIKASWATLRSMPRRLHPEETCSGPTIINQKLAAASCLSCLPADQMWTPKTAWEGPSTSRIAPEHPQPASTSRFVQDAAQFVRAQTQILFSAGHDYFFIASKIEKGWARGPTKCAEFSFRSPDSQPRAATPE